MESQFKNLLSHFYGFAKEYLGLNKEAAINFVSDPINSSDILGKTAHYDPSNFSVTVYVDGRHPKDILRSISHELVHHRQNCQGKMNEPRSTQPGYAQADEHLRGLEKEAYLVGNMCFRDWEDKYKANREVKTIYESTIRNFIKERINMKSNDELRNIVKEAVTKVLNKRTLKEFDRYGDEFASDEDDAYFADLAKDFPDMGLDDKPAGAEPEAPADVKADMEDEFGSSEPEEELEEENAGSKEELIKKFQNDVKIARKTAKDLEGYGMMDMAKAEMDKAELAIAQLAKLGAKPLEEMFDSQEELDAYLQNSGQMKTGTELGKEEEEKNEAASTDKHNDNPALTGDQKDELPDNLQKAIIDKEEETNEASMYPTEALIDILKTDPEFDLLASRADDVMANMKSGMTDEEALEAAYPDWVPGQLLHAALKKAKSGHSIPNRAISETESDVTTETAMGAGAVEGGAAQSFETEEDFYSQMRDEARTLSEDWNKSARNKRSQMLNERLMKAWKYTK